MKAAEILTRAYFLMFALKMSIKNNRRVVFHTNRAASTSIRALTVPNQISSSVREDWTASLKRVSMPSLAPKGREETKRRGHRASKLAWKSQKRNILKRFSILNPKTEMRGWIQVLVK